jgi:hypothetical protein
MPTKQQFWKGLIILLVGVLVTAYSQPTVDYWMMFATGLGALLPYLAKGIIAFWPSTSDINDLNWPNVLSGFLLALGSAITEGAAIFIVNHQMIWPLFGKLVAGVFLSYLSTTFFSRPAIQSAKLTFNFKQAA